MMCSRTPPILPAWLILLLTASKVCVVVCSKVPGCLATEYKHSTKSCTMLRSGHGRQANTTKTNNESDAYFFTRNESKDKRLNDLEIKVEKLLNDNKNRDSRLRDIKAAQAKKASEASVDCGSPTPPEGTDVVYSSTGLHAMANYTCNKGVLDIHPGQQIMSFCQKDGNWTMVNVKCVNISGCWTAPAGKVVYTGTRSTTRTGKACQRWDAQTPHDHINKKDVRFSILGFDTPQTVTGSANYCRDPDRTGYLWCYTTDPNSRWERCDVPKCEIQN